MLLILFHLSQGNPKNEYWLGDHWTESSPMGKVLGVLNEKLSMCLQPRRPMVSWAVWQGVASRTGAICPPLLTLMRSYGEHHVQIWGPQHKKRGGVGMHSEGWSESWNISYGVRLRKLDLSNLEEALCRPYSDLHEGHLQESWGGTPYQGFWP